MIESLILENFQCHSKTKIQLDKIVTVVGPSDIGKSAIIRALKFLVFNKARKNAIKHGEDSVTVSAKVDGRKIVRHKGKDFNGYKLDGKEFKALGQAGVPDEISNLLNLSEENFQNQLSSPFWFMQTPGEVAKELNRIVNLDLIDRVHAWLASELRKAKASVEVSEGRLSEAQRRQEELEWTRLANKKLTQVETKYNELEKERAEIISIESLIERIQEAESFLQDASKAIRDAEKAVLLATKAMESKKEVDRLEEMLKNIVIAEKLVVQAKREADESEGELKRLVGDKCPICGGKMK